MNWKILFIAIFFICGCSEKEREPTRVIMQCNGKFVLDWAEHTCGRDL